MSIFAGLPSMPARAALTLAERGLPVFPCNSENKKPLTKNGFYDATTELDQIRQWWRQWPGALIGYPTGETSGLVVIDVDAKAGDPDDILSELERQVDAMFRGPRLRTMHGGYHCVFQSDPRVRIGAGRFREGVDWRGNGGYAIAPDGKRYQLIVDGDPEPIPEALIDLIVRHQGQSPQLSVAGGMDAPAYRRTTAELTQGTFTEGQWHESMIRMVAIFARRGFSLNEIVSTAPMFQRAGYPLEDTVREVRAAAVGAFRKWGIDTAGAPSAEPRSIEIVGLDNIALRDPPAFQIDGVMPEKSFGYVYGKPGTLKTFLTLDMALSIAYGRPWHGRVTQPGPVLYILGEGQGAFGNRIQSWRQAHGLLETSAPFHVIFQPIAFTDRGDVGRLVDAIQQSGIQPAWVFLDTIARNFGGGDPDRTQDMTVFVAAVDAVRKHFDCGVFGVHHAGKDDTKGARNSSVLQASADFEIKTDRESKASPWITVSNTKAKDWEAFEDISLFAKSVGVINPRTGEEITSLVFADSGESGALPPPPKEPGVVGGKLERTIVSVLAEAGSLGFGELMRRCGEVERSSFGRALRSLQSKGLVLKTEEKPVVYYIMEGSGSE